MTRIPVREDPNPYLRSYYDAKGLKPGDTWTPYEYMKWIDSKHKVFQKAHGLVHPFYDEDTQALFEEFLKTEAQKEYSSQLARK